MNMFYLNSRLMVLSAICGGLLLLSACATTAGSGGSIEKRATARWQALLSDDLTAAYEYLSPGYRSSVSLKHYQRTVLLKKVHWRDAKYIESDCAETTCKVKISLDYTMYGGVPGVQSFKGTQTITESWVLTDGMWYLVPKQ